MPALTLDMKKIELLRDVPELIPVRWDNFENWTIWVINRAHHMCKNYLSANGVNSTKLFF